MLGTEEVPSSRGRGRAHINHHCRVGYVVHVRRGRSRVAVARGVIKAVFLLPERDNDGQPFPQSAWDRVGERLVRLGRGDTVAYGHKGIWQARGRRDVDVNNAYTVTLRSWEQLGAWIGRRPVGAGGGEAGHGTLDLVGRAGVCGGFEPLEAGGVGGVAGAVEGSREPAVGR